MRTLEVLTWMPWVLEFWFIGFFMFFWSNKSMSVTQFQFKVLHYLCEQLTFIIEEDSNWFSVSLKKSFRCPIENIHLYFSHKRDNSRFSICYQTTRPQRSCIGRFTYIWLDTHGSPLLRHHKPNPKASPPQTLFGYRHLFVAEPT